MRTSTPVVLLVGDSDCIRALDQIYRNSGWCVRSASVLSLVPLAMKLIKVDLIVSDYSLRDGSWRDIRAAMRSLGMDHPIVVVSCLADEHMWAEVLVVGGFDLMAPPFQPEEVLEMSAHACGLPGRAIKALPLPECSPPICREPA